MTLEQKLRDARIKCGLSQEELADRIEVSRQTISNWERGLVRPSADNLAILSGILGMPTDAFLKDGWAQAKQPEPIIQIREVPVEVPVEVRVEVPVEVPVEVRVEVPVEVPVIRPIRWYLLTLAAALILAAGITIGALLLREPPEDVVPSSQLETEVIDPDDAVYMPLLPLE